MAKNRSTAANPKNSKNPHISRAQALDARPHITTILNREALSDGGLRLTVPFYPSNMQRWLLRVPDTATRQFELDALGAEVLAMCDGQTNVRHMTRQFAQKHQVGAHEAESAVVTFLRTMVRKGLIVMMVEK